jgi:hypothetical protein
MIPYRRKSGRSKSEQLNGSADNVLNVPVPRKVAGGKIALLKLLMHGRGGAANVRNRFLMHGWKDRGLGPLQSPKSIVSRHGKAMKEAKARTRVGGAMVETYLCELDTVSCQALPLPTYPSPPTYKQTIS